MKILNKPLPILLVLLAVLGALIAYKNSHKVQKYQVEPALAADLVAQVEKILLTKDQEAVVLSKQGDFAWQVNEGPWWAQNSRVERLLQDLAHLKKADLLSKRADRLEQYGLDSAAQGVVGLVRGVDTTWLAIGKTDANFAGVFFRLKGQNEVYRSPGAMWIDGDARSWIDGKVFMTDPAALRQVSYTGADGTTTWVRDDTTQTSPEKWAEISGKVLSLTADEFWTSAPAHDSSAQSLTAYLTNGDSLNLQIWGESNGKYVAQHPNGSVVGINSWRLAGLNM